MTHVQKHTAVLLKEKGFDLPCRQYFIAIDDKIKNNQNNRPYNWNKIQAGYSAPLLFEATIWLRETKGVHVYVSTKDVKWAYTIEDIKIGKILSNSFWHFDNHDLALEAGIIHALKHFVK